MRVKIRNILMTIFLCASEGALAAEQFNIVTGTENGTNVRIGGDLAKYVAPAADIDLQVLPSKGSVDNIRRLRDEKGTRFALLQSDVYQAFKDQAAAGNAEAARVVTPLRVILPLFDAEVYFVVRADSPLNSIHDIQNKRINIGPLGGGVAMTSTTLYRLMFGTSIPEDNVSTFLKEEALTRLIKEKDVDVVVVTAGQPSALLTGMEPGVEKYFKLLKMDEGHAAIKRALAVYKKTAIKADLYPGWMTADMPSFAVTTLLVTYDYQLKDTRDSLARFAKSFCDNFHVLQKDGNPQWRQVSLQLPVLAKGWSYFPPTEQQLRRCQPPKPKKIRPCALDQKVLSLCAAE